MERLNARVFFFPFPRGADRDHAGLPLLLDRLPGLFAACLSSPSLTDAMVAAIELNLSHGGELARAGHGAHAVTCFARVSDSLPVAPARRRFNAL